MKTSIEERVWAKVDRRGADDCWEWKAHRNAQGYGTFRVADKVRKAHRVVYALVAGPIPDGMVIMHSCDNPPCCNPAHLSVGTYSDNARDAVSKGHQVIPLGSGGRYNRAKTHCPQGHGYTPENTSVGNGRRSCRTCSRDRTREYDRRRRASASAAAS